MMYLILLLALGLALDSYRSKLFFFRRRYVFDRRHL
jgi:hypothetical protein